MAFAVVSSLLLPGVSFAEASLPVVHLSILPGETPAQPPRLFADTLPRNTAFVMELPATPLTQSGLLHVWPASEKEPDCVSSAGKQAYCLPMSLDTVQGRLVLHASVPQLQSGIPFEFDVEQFELLLPDAAVSLAKDVSAAILEQQAAAPQPEPPPCDTTPFGSKSSYDHYRVLPKVADSASGLSDALGSAANDPNSREYLEQALSAALASEMSRRQISGDTNVIARLAVDDFFVTSERKAFLDRSQELEAKLAALKDSQARLCHTFEQVRKTIDDSAKSSAQTKALDPRLPAPTVFIDGKVVVLTDFFDKHHANLLADEPLTSAITQLSTWIGSTPAGSTGADPWRAALQSLLDADAAARPALALSIDRSGFPSSFVPAFWDAERRKLVALPTAVADFERLHPDVLQTQLESLRGNFTDAQQPAVTRMLTALRTLREDWDKRNKSRTDIEAARAARDAAFESIRGALARSLETQQVVSAFRTLRATRGHSDPKLLRTPPAGSFASPDLGAFVAAPLLIPHGSGNPAMQGDPWVLPYAGLNLYLEPVERDVPLDQLVERRRSFFSRQRWSATLGFVFKAEPSIRDRRVQAPILSAYPVVGIGYRVTSYLRVTGGAVGYMLMDANPASNRSSPAVAPFIGASIDTDLVSMLLNAANGKK